MSAFLKALGAVAGTLTFASNEAGAFPLPPKYHPVVAAVSATAVALSAWVSAFPGTTAQPQSK